MTAADIAHEKAHTDKRAHAFITLHRADRVSAEQAQHAIDAFTRTSTFFDSVKIQSEQGLSLTPAPPLGPLHLWFVVQGPPGSETSDAITHAETHNHLDRIAGRFMSLVTKNPGDPIFKFERHH